MYIVPYDERMTRGDESLSFQSKRRLNGDLREGGWNRNEECLNDATHFEELLEIINLAQSHRHENQSL